MEVRVEVGMEVTGQGLIRKERQEFELFGEARKAKEMKEIGQLLHEWSTRLVQGSRLLIESGTLVTYELLLHKDFHKEPKTQDVGFEFVKSVQKLLYTNGSLLHLSSA